MSVHSVHTSQEYWDAGMTEIYTDLKSNSQKLERLHVMLGEFSSSYVLLRMLFYSNVDTVNARMPHF